MSLLKALACQFIAVTMTFAIANVFLIFRNPIIFLLLETTLAIGSSFLMRQQTWWFVIHLLFLPSVFLFFKLALPASWYLGIVIVMVLVFWGTIRGDVPLFLSSTDVAENVITFLQRENAKSFAELGAGVGSVAIPVAEKISDIKVDAWERAPLPWLISLWRGRKKSNYQALRNDFFTANFGQYDVIFAFLSPAVMPAVGEKVKNEMNAGTLFISSSFSIPNWQPESIKQLDDFRKTILYCYRIEKSKK